MLTAVAYLVQHGYDIQAHMADGLQITRHYLTTPKITDNNMTIEASTLHRWSHTAAQAQPIKLP